MPKPMPVLMDDSRFFTTEAMAAPRSIGVDAVIEHALRHLSWLVKDDPAVMQSLASWKDLLAPYQPEPFRALA